MRLRYRGISYESNWARNLVDWHREVPELVLVLRYRGVFYLWSSISVSEDLSAVSPLECQAIGQFSFWLYRLGWQHRRHQNRFWYQHWLLGVFYYYRRGVSDAAQAIESDWVEPRYGRTGF